jgi:putative ABC transport system permease protein
LRYEIVLKDPSIAGVMAEKLEDEFKENGFKADSLEAIIRANASVRLGFNRLLQGFMGLGLVVGIAALGVIAARSVVERRVQIGVLRAIGFRRGMVQLTFLFESSLIALLGILLGFALAFGLSIGIINEIGESVEGMSYQVPWGTATTVALVAYGASLLTTFVPAWQASRIYPAEALRLDE